MKQKLSLSLKSELGPPFVVEARVGVGVGGFKLLGCNTCTYCVMYVKYIFSPDLQILISSALFLGNISSLLVHRSCFLHHYLIFVLHIQRVLHVSVI